MTEKHNVIRDQDFDTSSLLNKPLTEVIAILTEIAEMNSDKDLYLAFNTSGYSHTDVSLDMEYTELETDAEYRKRLTAERHFRRAKEKTQLAKGQKTRDLAEIKRLQRKWGT